MTLAAFLRSIWVQFAALVVTCWAAYWFWTYDGSHEMIACAAVHPNDAASICDPIGPSGLIVGFLSAILLFVLGTVCIVIMAVRRRRKHQLAI